MTVPHPIPNIILSLVPPIHVLPILLTLIIINNILSGLIQIITPDLVTNILLSNLIHVLLIPPAFIPTLIVIHCYSPSVIQNIKAIAITNQTFLKKAL